MKTESIIQLNLAYGPELKEQVCKIIGNSKEAEEVTALAFMALVRNSFWICSEERAKRFLQKYVTKECKKKQSKNI